MTTAFTTAFPSENFFRTLQRLMADQRDRFRVLGYFDVVFGVHVLPDRAGDSEQRFVLAFDVFDCVRADAVGAFGPELDFVLEGTRGVWREMIENIKQRGAADVAHSINTLTHFGDALRICYDDPDGHDKLFRFAESIQEFFNLAAHVDLELADGARGAGARPA
jgi:hypothetical protein